MCLIYEQMMESPDDSVTGLLFRVQVCAKYLSKIFGLPLRLIPSNRRSHLRCCPVQDVWDHFLSPIIDVTVRTGDLGS